MLSIEAVEEIMKKLGYKKDNELIDTYENEKYYVCITQLIALYGQKQLWSITMYIKRFFIEFACPHIETEFIILEQ